MAMQANHPLADVPLGLMQVGVVLPAQYYGSRRPRVPEEQLMIAVLHDARDCVEKYRLATHPHGQRLFREAAQWFLADEYSPYSFEWICLVLDLDSHAVRRRLRVEPLRGSPCAAAAARAPGPRPARHAGTRREPTSEV